MFFFIYLNQSSTNDTTIVSASIHQKSILNKHALSRHILNVPFQSQEPIVKWYSFMFVIHVFVFVNCFVTNQTVNFSPLNCLRFSFRDFYGRQYRMGFIFVESRSLVYYCLCPVYLNSDEQLTLSIIPSLLNFILIEPGNYVNIAAFLTKFLCDIILPVACSCISFLHCSPSISPQSLGK